MLFYFYLYFFMHLDNFTSVFPHGRCCLLAHTDSSLAPPGPHNR